MPSPLVSVICLCYNHAKFVYAAIESVYLQTYPNIEIIIIDDASTDQSQAEIKKALLHFTSLFPHRLVQSIFLEKNIGNCKAFNKALAVVKGKYVVDFATDDILLSHRIRTQVMFFEQLPLNYGVIFSNAQYIDENSILLHKHYSKQQEVPQGNIYAQIIAHSFICTPTMLIKKTVFDDLKGYDENLSYEDFDFWIRSACYYHYAYQDEILTYKRVVKNSLGSLFYTHKALPHLYSTLQVCYKIAAQNKKIIDDTEKKNANQALAHRLRYHIRLCCYTNHSQLAMDYYKLLSQTTTPTKIDNLWQNIAKLNLPINIFYRLYLKMRNLCKFSF
jgi:glycosyltransferase involved in cell wall biosynthesis